MTWFTYLTGLVIFAIGAVSKFVIHLIEWQALLPLVFGLGYLTLAEGMRTSTGHKRTFLFLAILWSILALVSMIPLAKEGAALMTKDPQRPVEPAMRSELVMEHSGVMLVCAAYLMIAVVSFFRKQKQATPGSHEISTTPGR